MKDLSRRTGPAAATSGARRAQTVFSLSEQETFELGRRFARELRDGDLVLLEGELGAGKTIFTRGIAAGLGIAQDEISSPTYTLIHEHRGGRRLLYHVDLYRLELAGELDTLGLDDLLGAKAVVVVEWGERLHASYRRDAVTVRLSDIGEGSRRIEVVQGTDASPRGTDA